MFAALAFALQSPDYSGENGNELYNVTHKPMADGLELLPKSYGEMKPKLGPPLPGDLGAAYLVAPVEPMAEASKLQRPVSYSAPRTAQRRYQQAPDLTPPQNPGSSGLFFQLSGRGEQTGHSKTANLDPQYFAQSPQYPDFTPPPSAFDANPLDTDPNKQDAKQAFLDRDADDIYNSHGLVSPRSPYQVMAGNLIPASLVTGLNSDLPGQVIGQVTENVFDTVTGQHLLIPQGSRLMGRYDSVIAFGQSRALVVWTRLILPNGDSIQLDNLPGSDAQGFAGLKDKVDKHTWQFIKGAALSSLLSIGSELASDDGDRLTRALQNAGQDTANTAGQRIIDRNLNVQPTLRVRQGWRFNVIVSRDLILKPYGD
ncbi:TrbI/VirB10 family protein [Robiginitomaculum antarcticum]|uniref:TrbI/VirB10 family protein n=1 Tax=Robiginitomaculum antarcticum TaxID=437507 RepID=UPI001F36ECE1|nr:TrbI/VirB10 family protein [Robiginitomaculum antarcticum]